MLGTGHEFNLPSGGLSTGRIQREQWVIGEGAVNSSSKAERYVNNNWLAHHPQSWRYFRGQRKQRYPGINVSPQRSGKHYSVIINGSKRTRKASAWSRHRKILPLCQPSRKIGHREAIDWRQRFRVIEIQKADSAHTWCISIRPRGTIIVQK